MFSSVNEALPWETVHRRQSRVKLSLTGKCQIKHTELFDVSVIIIINVGHALSSPWKSPQRMGSLTHFLGQWNITIIFYIQQKLKIRISSTSVRNSLSYLPFCMTCGRIPDFQYAQVIYFLTFSLHHNTLSTETKHSGSAMEQMAQEYLFS